MPDTPLRTPIRLARRLSSVAPSATLAITSKAAKLKADGVDVLAFSAGEPDFSTPQHIVDACEVSLRAGHHHYPPVGGVQPLRQAIAEDLSARWSAAVEPHRVVVTCGAKQALYLTFAALLDPGDEVLVVAPYWVSYPDQIGLCGGTPVVVPTHADSGFAPTAEALDAATTSRTRAIVFSSPSNPTGAVYDDRQLRVIADWAQRTGALVISDEMYEKLVFGGVPHRSVFDVAPGLREQFVYIGGFSKSYAMTGWRVGHLVAAPVLAEACITIQGHLNTNTAIFAQEAALAAILGPTEPIHQMRDTFEARGRRMSERLAAMPGLSLVPPRGAFYCFPDVTWWFGKSLDGTPIANAADFAAACLAHAHIAFVPGESFGAPSHVRMSFASSERQIDEGMNRLEALLTRNA